jgi:hypothetical protein
MGANHRSCFGFAKNRPRVARIKSCTTHVSLRVICHLAVRIFTKHAQPAAVGLQLDAEADRAVVCPASPDVRSHGAAHHERHHDLDVPLRPEDARQFSELPSRADGTD